MSRKKDNSSVWSKLVIGALGLIGGLLIGKAINNNDNNENKEKKVVKVVRAKVDPTEYTKNIDDYDNVENLMICPITNCLMQHPYIVIECGHTFEKEQIEKWVKIHHRCPLCNCETKMGSLRPNYQLEQVIEEYLKNKKASRLEREKRETEKVEVSKVEENEDASDKVETTKEQQ